MNTSLKNARIFDSDSWEETIDGLPDSQGGSCGLDDSFEIIDEIGSDDDDDGVDEETNFPISKETFANLPITTEISGQLSSLMKIDDDNSTNNSNDSNSRRSFKSAKKTSFKHKLDSPYKRADVTEKKLTTVTFNIDKKSDNKIANCAQRLPKQREMETDPVVLARRQKQIDYGKNTIAYDAYRKAVQKQERKLGDPETPNKYYKYSRRAFDGLIKKWRLLLHKYDPDKNS